MLAPLVRGADNHPSGELAHLAGGGEEGVDIDLLEVVILVVELALNGSVVPGGPLTGDQVDARIGALAPFRVVHPKPDIAVKVGIHRVLLQECADEAFELVPLITTADRLFSEPLEDVVYRLTH